MRNPLIAIWMGTLLAGSASAHDAIVEDAERFMLPDNWVEEIILLEEGPMLLASVAVAITTPDRVSDSWWSSGADGPRSEPTDPDSPGLNTGSSLETPWDAWENRDGLRGEWESLDPGDR